jgi:hypothetical protein
MKIDFNKKLNILRKQKSTQVDESGKTNRTEKIFENIERK